MTKKEIVKRLRDADAVDPKGLKAGRAFGRKWAEEIANTRLIRAVAKLVNIPVEEREEGWDDGAPPGWSPLCRTLSYVVADLPDRADVDEDDDQEERDRKGDERIEKMESALEALGEGGLFILDCEDFAVGFCKGVNDVMGELEGEI